MKSNVIVLQKIYGYLDFWKITLYVCVLVFELYCFHVFEGKLVYAFCIFGMFVYTYLVFFSCLIGNV